MVGADYSTGGGNEEIYVVQESRLLLDNQEGNEEIEIVWLSRLFLDYQDNLPAKERYITFLKENHKCQAQSQLYQNAIHCNWVYVEERDNNCQFQGYISQTVTQFENRECRICRHTKWPAPWAFLISAKNVVVKSQK